MVREPIYLNVEGIGMQHFYVSSLMFGLVFNANATNNAEESIFGALACNDHRSSFIKR